MIGPELPLAPRQARREAHEKAQETAETRRQEVYDLVRASPAGMTADEVAKVLGRAPYTIRPRITELKKCGLLIPIGRRPGMFSAVRITIWRAAA